MMKKYLISYGDAKYITQKDFFRETAVASGYFDHIDIFGPEDLTEEFVLATGSALQANRGAGYWLWKPFVIKKVLDKIEDNDVLVYCDAGCMINPTGGDRYKEYLDILASSKTGTIDFELPFKEYQYTKQEVFNYLGSTPEEIDSNQLLATVLLFKKCRAVTQLVDSWYQLAVSVPDLFTDQQTVLQQDGFIDHRHDQSVFSLLRKRSGATILKDETWFPDFVKDGRDFPFWATRLKG
jgi:hypothetical protein